MRINLLKKPEPNPRKAQPGTSYTADGLIPPDIAPEQGSSRSAPIQEIVPELASQFQRNQVYAQMMNDAGVDMSVRAWKTPMLGAEFFVEPYSSRDEDVLIAEFIEANLFGGMASPFVNSIEDVLHFCEDGYSVLEKVFENRNWAPKATGANGKTYTMLKKLGVRPISSIGKITYDDNGGPVSITHNAITGENKNKEVEIPINKLIIFTLNRKGGDITGKSLLRTSYPHWFYKTHMYKIDAIQKERHALGVPHGKLMPGYTAADKELLRTLLRNLRTNEESFAISVPSIELEFMEIKSQLVDVMASATHHNMMILMNVMAQFMSLGVQGEGGGRATAGAQTDMFVKSVKYVANYIAEQFNMYCIPELVVYNFKTTNFPQIKVRNIGDTRDLQMLASAIANLFAQDAITGDEDTENWIRRVFDMPLKVEGTRPTEADQLKSAASQNGATKQQRDKIGSNAGKPGTAAQ